LEAASEYARINVGDFIRRKALEAAEIDFLERRLVVIPATHWSAFEAWALGPPQKVAAAEKLARAPLKKRK
jgi:uncharacterized protein (DUF1778 family)